MHNLNIDTLLQQIITTTGIVDEDTNYLDHIDEHNFFTLTDQNRLLVSIWYLITLLTDHNLNTNVSNLNDLTNNTFNTKVTNDVNVNLNSNKVLVDNLSVLKDLLLTVKINSLPDTNLSTDTINALTTKLTNTEFKLSNSTLTELLNRLLSTVLTVKLDTKDINVTNFNELITKLAATTLNTNFAPLIASVLTVKLNNIDELNNLTVQTTNAVKPVVLTDNVINSIEVTNYSNAIYQITITGLIGNFSINVLGSLDNTNWFTLPLMTSSLNINNNAVLVSSNSTVMLNVNCNCKFIKLNTVSLPLLTRIDAKLYLK